MRSSLGRLITHSRRWAGWLRGNLHPNLMAIPVATVYMSRSCFVMCWFPDRSGTLYPRETLKTLLGLFDSTAWLVEHGVELPDWLT